MSNAAIPVGQIRRQEITPPSATSTTPVMRHSRIRSELLHNKPASQPAMSHTSRRRGNRDSSPTQASPMLRASNFQTSIQTYKINDQARDSREGVQ